MQKLELFYSTKFQTYQSQEQIIGSIGFFKLFLRDISLDGVISFIKWGKENKGDATGTNSMWLEQKPPYIFIGSDFTEPKAKLQHFKILTTEFIKVLTEWEKLVRAKTKKITITQIGDGNMSIYGA